MIAFRSQRYFSTNPTRTIRVEDLKAEYDYAVETALSAIQCGEDRKAACFAARAEVLKELIEVLEKGVAAPDPESGTSEIP